MDRKVGETLSHREKISGGGEAGSESGAVPRGGPVTGEQKAGRVFAGNSVFFEIRVGGPPSQPCLPFLGCLLSPDNFDDSIVVSHRARGSTKTKRTLKFDLCDFARRRRRCVRGTEFFLESFRFWEIRAGFVRNSMKYSLNWGLLITSQLRYRRDDVARD